MSLHTLPQLVAAALLGIGAAPLAGEELPVEKRIGGREFPSVFQAWNEATPVAGADKAAMRAKHDLIFVHPSMVGLRSAEAFEGTAFGFTPESLAAAQAERRALLAKNPQLVLLAEIRYRDAPKGFIPEDSPWWKRDEGGKFVMGWEEGGYRLLDVAHPGWHQQVAARAKAVMDTGVFDGVMLDWWTDDEDRLALIRQVRGAIGDQALVLVNANDREVPRTAAFVNGLFMECYRSESPEDWQRISKTLRWAEKNLRAPRINCLEAWYRQSRQDLHLMRSITTLSLTHSDGYCLFSDPNDLPTPDHLHDWYSFWDKGIGKPAAAGFQRPDGAWQRAFTGGTALHNPAGGKPVTARFDSPHQSRATGRIGTEHAVPANDGDLFIRVKAAR